MCDSKNSMSINHTHEKHFKHKGWNSQYHRGWEAPLESPSPTPAARRVTRGGFHGMQDLLHHLPGTGTRRTGQFAFSNINTARLHKNVWAFHNLTIFKRDRSTPP